MHFHFLKSTITYSQRYVQFRISCNAILFIRIVLFTLNHLHNYSFLEHRNVSIRFYFKAEFPNIFVSESTLNKYNNSVVEFI